MLAKNSYEKQKALSSLRKRLFAYCDEWKQKDVPILIAISDEVEEKTIMPYRVIVNMFVQKIKDIKHILEIIGVDVFLLKPMKIFYFLLQVMTIQTSTWMRCPLPI